jgi:Clp amino terminal domain, pathogenicity island component
MGLAAEAGGADYLSTCHLLLAMARHCPEATGVDYTAARSAAGYPRSGSGRAAPAADAPAGERWPTPRLRQAVARAARGAQADGRPVSPRDLWHALLTDPDAECRAVLDALGVTAAGGAWSLVGG